MVKTPFREHTHKKGSLNLGIVQIKGDPPIENLGTQGEYFTLISIDVPDVNTMCVKRTSKKIQLTARKSHTILQ